MQQEITEFTTTINKNESPLSEHVNNVMSKFTFRLQKYNDI